MWSVRRSHVESIGFPVIGAWVCRVLGESEYVARRPVVSGTRRERGTWTGTVKWIQRKGGTARVSPGCLLAVSVAPAWVLLLGAEDLKEPQGTESPGETASLLDGRDGSRCSQPAGMVAESKNRDPGLPVWLRLCLPVQQEKPLQMRKPAHHS